MPRHRVAAVGRALWLTGLPGCRSAGIHERMQPCSAEFYTEHITPLSHVAHSARSIRLGCGYPGVTRTDAAMTSRAMPPAIMHRISDPPAGIGTGGVHRGARNGVSAGGGGARPAVRNMHPLPYVSADGTESGDAADFSGVLSVMVSSRGGLFNGGLREDGRVRSGTLVGRSSWNQVQPVRRSQEE